MFFHPFSLRPLLLILCHQLCKWMVLYGFVFAQVEWLKKLAFMFSFLILHEHFTSTPLSFEKLNFVPWSLMWNIQGNIFRVKWSVADLYVSLPLSSVVMTGAVKRRRLLEVWQSIIQCSLFMELSFLLEECNSVVFMSSLLVSCQWVLYFSIR